jgi:hypothetical protein
MRTDVIAFAGASVLSSASLPGPVSAAPCRRGNMTSSLLGACPPLLIQHVLTILSRLFPRLCNLPSPLTQGVSRSRRVRQCRSNLGGTRKGESRRRNGSRRCPSSQFGALPVRICFPWRSSHRPCLLHSERVYYRCRPWRSNAASATAAETGLGTSPLPSSGVALEAVPSDWGPTFLITRMPLSLPPGLLH